MPTTVIDFAFDKFVFFSAQTTCNQGIGRIVYERLPDQQLQGFDDDVVSARLIFRVHLRTAQSRGIRTIAFLSVRRNRVRTSVNTRVRFPGIENLYVYVKTRVTYGKGFCRFTFTYRISRKCSNSPRIFTWRTIKSIQNLIHSVKPIV